MSLRLARIITALSIPASIASATCVTVGSRHNSVAAGFIAGMILGATVVLQVWATGRLIEELKKATQK